MSVNIEIQTINKRVKEEVEFYITSDKRKFKSAYDAVMHEKEYKIKSLKKRNDLICVEEEFLPYGKSYVDEDYSYKWYRPTSTKAIDAIVKAYTVETNFDDHNNYSAGYFAEPISYDLVDEWFCIEDTGEPELHYYTLEDSIKEFSILLQTLSCFNEYVSESSDACACPCFTLKEPIIKYLDLTKTLGYVLFR